MYHIFDSRANPLCPGVIGLVSLFHLIPCDMGIDLRCGDITVPQHLLDITDISAMIQKMRCKAVTQCVRMSLWDAGSEKTVVQDPP